MLTPEQAREQTKVGYIKKLDRLKNNILFRIDESSKEGGSRYTQSVPAHEIRIAYDLVKLLKEDGWKAKVVEPWFEEYSYILVEW